MSFGYRLLGFGSGGSELTAATGGTEGKFEGYKFHEFKSSGTFTVLMDYDFDILMIGGGGSGGNTNGGGGGSGGFVYYSAKTLAVGDYTVVIGAGGVSGYYSPYNGDYTGGQDGEDTTFTGLTTAVGGGGGGAGASATGNDQHGQDGGSGGGCGSTWLAGNEGVGTSNQGNMRM